MNFSVETSKNNTEQMKPSELINFRAQFYSRGALKIYEILKSLNFDEKTINEAEQDLNSSNITVKFRINKEFCESEDTLAAIQKEFHELLSKLFRLGRNKSFPVRKFVDNIEWDFTIEKITTCQGLLQKKGLTDEKEGHFLCFRAKIKEDSELMQDYKNDLKMDIFFEENLEENFEVDMCSYDLLAIAKHLVITESLTENFGENSVVSSSFKAKIESQFLTYSRKEKKELIQKFEKFLGNLIPQKALIPFSEGNVQFKIGNDGNIAEMINDFADILNIDPNDLKFEKKDEKITTSVNKFKELLEKYLYPDITVYFRPNQALLVFSVDGQNGFDLFNCLVNTYMN